MAKWDYAISSGDYNLSFAQADPRLVFGVAQKNSGSMVIDSIETEVPPTNCWTHVAATFNRGTMTLYLDGRLVTNRTSTTVTNTTLAEYTGDEVVVGSHRSEAYNFDGGIDDVRIYNRALSVQEAAELYSLNAGPSVSLTQPTDGAVYYSPPAVTAQVSAVDGDG